jgi:hypothetical protein
MGNSKLVVPAPIAKGIFMVRISSGNRDVFVKKYLTR